MKFSSVMRFDILKIISYIKGPLKHITTQAVEINKSNKILLPKKDVNNICSIVLEINHVSWAKISLPDLSLVEWNGYSLPVDFQKINMESNVLSIAIELNQAIPSSDLYLVERQKKFNSSLNEIYLKAMLILLICLDKDQQVQDRVIMQNPYVLNRAFKLLIGSERKSTRPIVSKLLECGNQNNISFDNDEHPDCFLDLEISEEHRNFFENSPMEKQESLSLALLLSLTYLKKDYFAQQINQNKREIKKHFVKFS